jgi:hypothetical protein
MSALSVKVTTSFPRKRESILRVSCRRHFAMSSNGKPSMGSRLRGCRKRVKNRVFSSMASLQFKDLQRQYFVSHVFCDNLLRGNDDGFHT